MRLFWFHLGFFCIAERFYTRSSVALRPLRSNVRFQLGGFRRRGSGPLQILSAWSIFAREAGVVSAEVSERFTSTIIVTLAASRTERKMTTIIIIIIIIISIITVKIPMLVLMVEHIACNVLHRLFMLTPSVPKLLHALGVDEYPAGFRVTGPRP